MRPPVQLWIVTLQTPAELADAVSELFAEDAVSLAIMAPPRKPTATVEAIFDFEPKAEEITARLAVFSAIQGVDLPKPLVTLAPPLDWLKKVAEDFPPIKIARWTIFGAMHRDKIANPLRALQIDATSAFGTGEHPTTRGCLIMLDEILKRGFKPRRMADIGCGSGILAMACMQAARATGMSVASAVDMDPLSVQIAARNMRGNGLGGKIRVGVGKGYAPSFIRRAAPYDLIMANIFARPLCQMAWNLKNNLRPGGMAILSGLLTTQAKLVIAAHRMQGLALIKHIKIGEWSILALTRPRRA